MTATIRVAGVNFDHFHMGDLLRMASTTEGVEIVGIADEFPARMEAVVKALSLSPGIVFDDYRTCVEKTQPDLVILCPSTAGHAEWVEKLAQFRVHLLMEKPFAASLADADRMIRAVESAGTRLAINWPLAWSAPHRTAARIISEGAIGRILEFTYYGGNRGPLYHLADKVEVSDEEVAARKPESWFYRKASGGGSLLDYLGYGTTLGTWFNGGQVPDEVTAVTGGDPALEVDEHSVTIARYGNYLTVFQTRWGSFTDPWVTQPQPKCGFVIRGEDGTISSYDYDTVVRMQTRQRQEIHELPVDAIKAPFQNPIQYFTHCIRTGEPVSGPLSLAISRIGQQIVDAAALSAQLKQTVALKKESR